MAKARACEKLSCDALLAWVCRVSLPAAVWRDIDVGFNSVSDFVASDRLAYALGPFYWEVRESAGAPSRVVTGTHVTILVREGRRWKIRSQILRPQAEQDVP